MSETPETNAEGYRQFPDGDFSDATYCITVGFARSLERRLRAAEGDAAAFKQSLEGEIRAHKATVEDLTTELEEREKAQRCFELSSDTNAKLVVCIYDFEQKLIAEREELKNARTAFADQLVYVVSLEQRIADLERRLEIGYGYDADGNEVLIAGDHPDGIECRDATIKMLEQRISDLERQLQFREQAFSQERP